MRWDFRNVLGFSCFLSFSVISLCSTLLLCSVFLCYVLLQVFFDSIKMINVKCECENRKDSRVLKNEIELPIGGLTKCSLEPFQLSGSDADKARRCPIIVRDRGTISSACELTVERRDQRRWSCVVDGATPSIQPQAKPVIRSAMRCWQGSQRSASRAYT